MSAQFIVKFMGQPVRFFESPEGHFVCYLVPDAVGATVFISEPDAWTATIDYGLHKKAEFCEVVNFHPV